MGRGAGLREAYLGAVPCDPDAAVKECTVAVRKVLGKDWAFTKCHVQHQWSRYALVCPNATTAEVGSRQYRVGYLISSQAGELWIGAEICFHSPGDGRCYVHGAQVLVFEGMAVDALKVPLLRAEWEDVPTRTAVDSDDHAQPHWHVYSHGTGVGETFRPEFDESDVPVLEFGAQTATGTEIDEPSVSGYVTKIHLAMSAQWDKVPPVQPKPHRHQLTPKALAPWLASCIGYIKDELLYALGLAPAC